MAFAVFEEVTADARIVSIQGEFDALSAAEAGPVLLRASADPDRVLVIDLTTCTFLDSSAIAAIVGAARALMNGQIKIAIACEPGSEPMRILRLAGIDRTVPVLPDAALALESALATD